MPEKLPHVRPITYFTEVWTELDAALLKAELNNSRYQAHWEAYTLLLALRAWVKFPWSGPILVVGDALGVLAAFVQMSAKSTGINAMAREAALLMAPLGRELGAVH
eukprot:810744-Amphidinium_carterae.1